MYSYKSSLSPSFSLSPFLSLFLHLSVDCIYVFLRFRVNPVLLFVTIETCQVCESHSSSALEFSLLS